MCLKFIRLALFVPAILFFCQKRPALAGQIESDLRAKTIQVHSTWNVAANVSTHVVIVSLSSTTAYPNPTNETGYINLNNLYIQTDKLAASTCTVKIGVITYVDTSTGSVKYFAALISSRSVSNNLNNYFYEADNSFRNLKVISATPNSGFDGVTPYLISNEILSGSTIFQTDVVLPAVNRQNNSDSSSGGLFPGLGDIVASIQNLDATNAVNVTIDAEYHYNAR